eukprot:1029009-Rhodomonas_salina.4
MQQYCHTAFRGTSSTAMLHIMGWGASSWDQISGADFRPQAPISGAAQPSGSHLSVVPCVRRRLRPLFRPFVPVAPFRLRICCYALARSCP